MSTQIETILIKNAPDIHGLTFRGFLGEEDFPIMAEIINAVNVADNEDQVATVENIAINYQYIQRSDPKKDMLFIEIDGKPVGYGRCMWDQEAEGEYLYSMFLHLAPEGRGRGIGQPVVEYFLDRMALMAAGHPAEAKKSFQTWSSEKKPWWNELVEMLGFKPVRYWYGMRRPAGLPVEITPLPDGVEVRPVIDGHMRAIFDAEAEAFRDHWGYVEPDEKDFQRWLADPDQDPSLWKVAWEGDQVVGMVLNFIDKESNQAFSRKRGYTENISVRRPWRRKGVARSLLTESIQMFLDMGMEETYLGVDTDNPSGALKLYNSVGYEKDESGCTYRKELQS